MRKRDPQGGHKAGTPPRTGQDRANPLRRGADRAQAWTARLLILLAALLLPVAAFAAGSSVYHASQATSQVQTADRHRAGAITTRTAENNPFAARVPVPVRIIDPGHPARSAFAQVRPETPAGTRLQVYVDNRSGRIVPPPARVDMEGAVLAAAGTVLAGGLVAWGALGLLKVLADRWRLVRWQREWRVVEPDWSARSRRRPGRGRP